MTNPVSAHAEQAFHALFASTCQHITHQAARMRVPTYAIDDVVQDTYLIAFRRLPEFRGTAALRHWLSSILKNVVRNYFRQQRRRGRGEALSSEVVDPSQLVDGSPGPDELVSSHQTAQAVRNAMKRLDRAQANVFQSVELEGSTVAEIANETSTKPQTVYSRLKAARRVFRRAMLQRALAQPAFPRSDRLAHPGAVAP